MNPTYIECLRGMGRTVIPSDRGWHVSGQDEILTDAELINFTLTELSKREDVMERVAGALSMAVSTDAQWYEVGHKNRVFRFELGDQKPDGGNDVQLIEVISYQDAIKKAIELNITAQELLGVSEWVCVCGNIPCDGLNCGVWLKGQKPRKQPRKQNPIEASEQRRRAWETRRERYGERGHR
jgi:hypothetical protein